MRPCPYYQIWCKSLPRRAAPSLQTVQHLEIKVSYCSHAQSPETLEMAQHHLGSDEGLKCGGNLRRCPLPDGIKPTDSRDESMLSWDEDELVPVEARK